MNVVVLVFTLSGLLFIGITAIIVLYSLFETILRILNDNEYKSYTQRRIVYLSTRALLFIIIFVMIVGPPLYLVTVYVSQYGPVIYVIGIIGVIPVIIFEMGVVSMIADYITGE